MVHYYYNKNGELIVNNRRVPKATKRFLRVWGYIVALFFIIIGIIIGKYL